ncbi:UNVERIFIED_CONTAM: hypothetical protein Sradi_1700100 [Sesamum radiatum]|uniref:Reverse transcriptase n=1 Tax=Sesamum radiatum TaxID=300843 RepID=A0AAW2TSY1_SESRA
MWEKLLELGRPLSISWLIVGNFNFVKSPTKKQLGVLPTWYELKDFVDCCIAPGLHDAPTTDCYYTWYSNSDSNPVWCKLDRVFLNNDWLEADCIVLPISTHRDASPITFRNSLVSTPRSWVPRIRHNWLDDGVFEWGPCSLRSLPRTFAEQSHRQRSGWILRQLNHTIIALVPKSEHSNSVADYRPLSCCNVIYKVITKIIPDCLSTALEHLIDSSQAAFVGGQNITNIFLTQEMVR